MKLLKVNVEEVAMIMDNQDRFEHQYYLDTETGETIAIPDELMRAVEEGESYKGLPEWEMELLSQAKAIHEASPRYQEIPVRFSSEGYNLMVEFVEGLTDSRVQRELHSAMDGKGAFRRFKDVLRNYPEVEKEWFKFKAERNKEKVREWLESIGIELRE